MHADPPVDPPTYEAPKTRIMGRGRAQTTPSASSKKRKGDDDDNNNRSATKKDVSEIISQYVTSSPPSTTSSRSSDERDAETIISYIKGIRSSKDTQLKLLTGVMKKLNLDNRPVSEENEKLALGLLEMASRSTGGLGRPTKDKYVVTTFIATAALVGAALKERKSENDDMDDGQPKSPRRTAEIATRNHFIRPKAGQGYGNFDENRRDGGVNSEQYTIRGCPLHPPTPHPLETRAEPRKIRDPAQSRLRQILAQRRPFPLRNVLIGGKRAKNLKSRGTSEGGEVHQARSCGSEGERSTKRDRAAARRMRIFLTIFTRRCITKRCPRSAEMGAK